MKATLLLASGALAGLLLSGCEGSEASRAGREAKRAVAATLKDPTSARWGDVWAYGGVICGYVNAKNSYGAYEGPRRFLTAGRSVQFEGGELGPNFERVWDVSCYKAEYTISHGSPVGPKATGPRTPGQVMVDDARFQEVLMAAERPR